MAKTSPGSLEAFLRARDADELVALLLEFAAAHDDVAARLARLRLVDRPDKLAARFRKTLTSWKRSRHFHDDREAAGFGQTLQTWLDQVAQELLPIDPPAAVALFQDFIEADAAWFERADDSGGAIGDAVRSACRHWLAAAARCETPADVWPERLLALYEGDEYGAREALLRDAHELLEEAAQRALVERLESELRQVVAQAPPGSHPSYAVFRLSAALSLLSESLRDPDVAVRATLVHSPQPNPMQRQGFVQAYLDADRPADALRWLADPWGHLEYSREDSLAIALERLGRHTESTPIRQRIFERTLLASDFERWLRYLDEAQRPPATDRARTLARSHTDLVAAVTLLLALGDIDDAEARLLSECAHLNGLDYGRLVPLAQALRSQDCPAGETVVYRALLQGILDRAYARAYGHAARYWARLGELATAGVPWGRLTPHDEFIAGIRARHARKTAFWAHVNGHRRDRHDADLEP